MNIFLNEKKFHLENNMSLFQLKALIKKDADVVIYNGFPLKEDMPLKENDKVVFIKKGEIPKKEELEALMAARHTPLVHEKLKKFKVGIAGLGGLGSNTAISLARMGIGKLLLVDFDVVEPSNLNRQQYFVRHIGMKKTDALKEIIMDCNPFIQVETKDLFLTEENIAKTFKDVDIIVEAFDNPEYKASLVNIFLKDLKDKKLVSASGMAGYFSSNTIKTTRIKENFYMVGDGVSEAQPGCGLMAPRVAIAANHEANAVIRIILDQKD
jgi:sulfur carrier protein ThiS adenylyltransferase